MSDLYDKVDVNFLLEERAEHEYLYELGKTMKFYLEYY